MKFFIPFFVVLFYFHLGFVFSEYEEIFSAPATRTFVSTTPSQNDYLESISIQDVLSSDIDASEKIEKKIIDLVTQYAFIYQTREKIDLSIRGFTFPERTIFIDLGSAHAIFKNVRVSESSQNYNKDNQYSISVKCDSAGTTRIEIKLPRYLEISAELTVTGITNSSREFSSASEILDYGSISLTLKHYFVKQTSTQTDDANNIAWKIFYSQSKVSLNIDSKFQMPIYNKLQIFFDEVELPIRQFLTEQLHEEFDCSIFTNAEKYTKKIHLPFFNSNLNNLYVIHDTRLQLCTGVSLSAGPVLIDGLSSFDNIEFTASEKENDHAYNKKMTAKIKTNNLKGKVAWSYNFTPRSVSFIIEFIQFVFEKGDFPPCDQMYYSYDDYSSTQNNKTNINVYLGNVQINSSKSSSCENESEFVNFVLSQYLKTVIADSLKNSLHKKIQNKSLFIKCH